jgi:hypothetical protein
MPGASFHPKEIAIMAGSSAELRKLAIEALRAHRGDPTAALAKFAAMLRKRNDLLDAIAFDYLQSIQRKEKIEPPPPEKPVKVREHRRQRQRTKEERNAALSVAARQVEVLGSIFDQRQINGRPIGDMRWGELTRECRDNALNAASYLRLGAEATENALLLKKIHDFAVVDDHARKIRDVINAEQLDRLSQEARRETPHMIEIGMRQYAHAIEHTASKEISQ